MRYAIVLILAGCATAAQPSYRWHRDGATQEQLTTESAQCEQAGASIPSRDPERVMRVMMSCMVGKGWRLVDR